MEGSSGNVNNEALDRKILLMMWLMISGTDLDAGIMRQVRRQNLILSCPPGIFINGDRDNCQR